MCAHTCVYTIIELQTNNMLITTFPNTFVIKPPINVFDNKHFNAKEPAVVPERA